ncbi:uncharacterized protein DUF955 [Melghiribacillus thermohalophilus]|uniref:Uncharacterized protein DUF955 n=1 Tax=Melghiribacillus thermohalophilus TaxID=1324956 RepID=A0A4R3N4N9_9BACI|nr:ImmA/IrrE family metallo-endopeptidase [Melghiribacillus thermohalophilus]TCT23347.1 uncharacterized protein DUF955 [Melghiribacillus thermohalophilus]
MYFPQYITTALEDWVTNLYKRLGIYDPGELKVSRICRYFEIFLKRKEMPSRFDIIGRYKAITVDSRLTVQKQREQFFHELCHVLRHVGNQSMMPEALRELQERDARHFTRYAALPFHMIRRYDLSDPDILRILADDFRVSESIVLERLLQIERRSREFCTMQVAEKDIPFK